MKRGFVVSKEKWHSLLEIKSLVLLVHLGRDKQERDKLQEVAFDITVGFLEPLREEKSDQLDKGSACYFRLCEKIREVATQGRFALIERLAGVTLEQIKPLIPSKAGIKVSVHKIHPPVPCLKGGVSYTCGNLSLP